MTITVRAPEPVSRRSLVAAMAALPAAAAAGAPPAAAAPDAGPSAAPRPDAALLALGRQLAEIEPVLDAARAHERGCWARYVEPAEPAALYIRPGDRNLDLLRHRPLNRTDPFYLGDEVRKLSATPRFRSEPWGHCPVTGQTWPADEKPPAGATQGHGFLKREPWPEAQARADEIVAAWKDWIAECNRREEETGAAAASEAVDDLLAQRRDICAAITAAPAATVAGLWVKASAAAAHRATLDPTDDDGPAVRALLSIARDLVRIRG